MIEIKEIDKQLAIDFVQTYHYSKILPRLTRYYLGCYEGDKLCGVITLGWGTQPLQTIKKLFYKHTLITTNYIEIGKMCFLPSCNNSNFGSRAISQLVGSFKTSVYMDRVTGEKIHPRSSKQLCIENAEFEGKDKVFWLTHNFCQYKGIDKINGLMFRYVYPLNRASKTILKDYPEYKGLKNPKNDALVFEKRVANGKFEKIEQPTFNMSVFNHNYQKY